MIGYFNSFKDNNKTMLFLTDDKDLLKNYIKVWEKNKRLTW